MRFSQDFRDAQIPEWVLYYIPYDTLKANLKQGKVITQVLKARCITTNQFYLQQLATLHGEVDNLQSSTATHAASIIDTRTTELFQNARRLLLFAKTNNDAINRLYRRIGGPEASTGSDGILDLQPCIALVEAAENLRSALEVSSEHANTIDAVTKNGNPHPVNLHVSEESTGRTRLCIASIRGDLKAVQSLLDAGADPAQQDLRGWLPIEHAAYRGHFPVFGLLDRYHRDRRLPFPSDKLAFPLERSSYAIPGSHVPRLYKVALGPGESHLWISLGSNDATKHSLPIVFNANEDGLTKLEQEAMYMLSCSTQDDSSRTYETALPLLGNDINSPCYFVAKDMANTQVILRLYKYCTTNETQKTLVGGGIALIGDQNFGVRPFRESVRREMTVPIQDLSNLSCIAKVTVSYLFVTPYSIPPLLAKPRPWSFGNGIGGHRGSGKNKLDSKRLQIGENTLQSFVTALEHGASFLETDVQLTKDLVPVIYHDLLVSETGTDSPLHTLTYEQFEYLNQAQGPRSAPLSRSNSLRSADRGYLDDMSQRMARTHFNKINGFKSNTRGNFIHEKSCTLEDILTIIPTSVNLNIELKYTMLFEADEWDMETVVIKADIFVNRVLDIVCKHAQGRRIVFSSFSPEICIAMSTKQRTWPVFFISKTAAPRGEVRSSSIQQAVHFAKSWGLPGIVVECTPLIKAPRLINYVRSAGLALMSFGVMNSEPKCAKIQFDAGIDAVISDSVRAITHLSNLTTADPHDKPNLVFP